MDKEDNKSKQFIVIENANLLGGIFASLHNAENFYKSAKTLELNEDFQSSIPLATISMEESLKGLELLCRYHHNEDLTEDVWNDMKTHKHKLTYIMSKSSEELKKGSTKDLEQAKRKLEKTGIKINFPELISSLQKRTAIHTHFQTLRESCFYADWNKLQGNWILFDVLSADTKSKLAHYVICEAEITLNIFKRLIEKYVNRLRETGQLLEKLPYPSYIEYRTIEKFESNSLQDPRKDKVNQVKYNEGLKIMQQFIEIRSFEFLDFGIYRKTMLEYLCVLGKQKPDQWFPHPMIKAMMMALSKTHQLDKEDENIAAISGDSDVTYGGKPMMIFNVITKLKSGIIEFVDIKEISKKITCQNDLVEKIIRTEKIIERQEGKDVSVAIFIEALNSVGIKSKMIKSDEISDAIKIAKKYVSSKKLQVNEKIIKQILTIKDSKEWDQIDSDVKTIICQTYGHNKYSSYNLYMTPSVEIRKSKCRNIIFIVLTQGSLKTA